MQKRSDLKVKHIKYSQELNVLFMFELGNECKII